MFFFKSKLQIPVTIFSFCNTQTLLRNDNVFLKVKITSKETSSLFLKAHLFKAKTSSFFFSFCNKFCFSAKPLFVFNNTLSFSDPKCDQVFSQFSQNYFISRNKQFVLEIFNKFFHYLFDLDTAKKIIYLYRFLKFIEERKVLTEAEFNSVFRDFNGA